jgi:DNA adenine methylase
MMNVPFGKHHEPSICCTDNLLAMSEALQGVKIHLGDYHDVNSFVDDKTLVYFDPPYRPITKTATFTSYTKDGFNDDDQKELANFSRKLSKRGAKVILSNSDPKNENPDDNFFDVVYKWAKIVRVSASRAINSKGTARGKISEILVVA